MEGDVFLVSVLENMFQISGAILLLCGIYYYRHFKKMRRERKLTKSEATIYIITKIAMFCYGVSYFLLFLDQS